LDIISAKSPEATKTNPTLWFLIENKLTLSFEKNKLSHERTTSDHQTRT
jgi:hypothetical protein